VKPLRVMVITPDLGLGRYLADQLPRNLFEVFDARPGPQFVDATYAISPHIAVLDHIEKRTEGVQLEIALLQKRVPRVRIILIK